MSHKDILTTLIPVEMGATSAADLEIEGTLLDAAHDKGISLLADIQPSSSYDLLSNWSKLTGLVPGIGEPTQSRRDKVIRKLRELGDIKKPYFEMLARSLGYEIYIQEYLPTMSGWITAGEELIVTDEPAVLFIWNVHVFNQSIYHFTAGQSLAGDYLSWWRPAPELEEILEDLRPAHVTLTFSYE